MFLNNRGEMTCFNARDGEQKRWQIRTTADWTEDGVARPSLAAFTARVGGRVDLAVAVGSRSIVFVNAKGYRASPPIEITTPTAPLLATDVDGGGLTGVVAGAVQRLRVVTATAVGYPTVHVSHRRARDDDGGRLRASTSRRRVSRRRPRSTDVDALARDAFSSATGTTKTTTTTAVEMKTVRPRATPPRGFTTRDDARGVRGNEQKRR